MIKMRTNKIFIVLMVGLMCQKLIGQLKVWTLEECIELAIEKNISIKQGQLNYEDALIDKNTAKANFLPTINFNANHSWNIGLNQNITTGLFENMTTQFSSGNLSLGVDIYRGKQNFVQLYRANLALLARQYQIEDIMDDTKLLVANAYLQIMFNKEIVNVQKTQLDLVKTQLERTTNLVEAGILIENDRIDLIAEVASQEQNLVLSNNNLRLSKINLAQLLLITDYENFDILTEDLDVPFSQVIEQGPKKIFEKALSFRNDIKLAIANVEIAEADIKLAKGNLLPSLLGFYSFSTRLSYADRIRGSGEFQEIPIGFVRSSGEVVNTNREILEIIGPLPVFDQLGINDGHNFGIQLNIPIFNGLRNRNNFRQSKINLERSKNSMEQQKLNLETTINQAFNDTKGAYTLYEAAKKTKDARLTSFNNSRDRFDEGLIDSFNYLQIKQSYDLSVSDEIRAKYDYIFKLKVLEFYFGIPISV